MMQNYELMLLLNPNAMDEVDDFLKGLEDIIKGDKGDLVEKIARKKTTCISNQQYELC